MKTRDDDRYSLLSQTPDRGTYVAYFLGAVVPLVTLGIVLERYVFRTASDPMADYGLEPREVLLVFTGIATLSLFCFFLLRRVMVEAIAENRALARYDSLTGLPNRRMFSERLEQALTHASSDGSIVGVCFLDLDGFKRVNDTLGHGSGDQLLSQVAERLTEAVRISDTVARNGGVLEEASVSRLGGDEFTVLLTGISAPHDAGRVARRILDALRDPFRLEHHEVFATASIGISVSPLDGETADALLKSADTAMYAAKDCGRDNFRFYDRSMNAESSRKLEIERGLRIALDQGAFSLHYQPLRDATSGALSGAEALLRWEDPELGLVSPEEFVPIAEDAGLIYPIGSWVLRTACAQAQEWQDAGFRPVRMAVNLSGHQIRHPEFIGSVYRTLEETRLSAEWLEIEITETTIMQNDEVTDRAFWSLDHLGIGLALDDFGTGYSSLSYLRRFPVRRVKIDRSFVAKIPDDPNDLAMAAAIVAMAHSLQLSVVGEGVENERQARALQEFGCEEIQGFLLSPAVSAGEFVRFLERDKDE